MSRVDMDNLRCGYVSTMGLHEPYRRVLVARCFSSTTCPRTGRLAGRFANGSERFGPVDGRLHRPAM